MIICVTGQVGSGKTTICKILKEIDKNVNLIDADKIGHNLLNKKIVKEKLIKEFGKNIIDNNKEINRKKLAKIAFNNRNNLQRLNKIIHPLLIKEIKEKINNKTRKNSKGIFCELRNSQKRISGFPEKPKVFLRIPGMQSIPVKINIIDAALFYELKLKDICDKIIIVKTNKKNILQRNKNKNIENIMKIQKIIKEGGIIVNNDKDKKELKNKIAKIYQTLRNKN